MQHDIIVDASITLSCKPKISGEILATFRNRPECETMFRNTCFGRWLDIHNVDRDHFLLHCVFCHEVFTDPRSQGQEMVFEIGDFELSFGKKNFVSSSVFGLVFKHLLNE